MVLDDEPNLRSDFGYRSVRVAVMTSHLALRLYGLASLCSEPTFLGAAPMNTHFCARASRPPEFRSPFLRGEHLCGVLPSFLGGAVDGGGLAS